jgi:hypothetical protein
MIVPKTGLNGSRTANYIAQQPVTNPTNGQLLANTFHTDFYARTCNWLYNEMEQLPDNVACTQNNECLPLQIVKTPTSCEGINEFSVVNNAGNIPVSYTVTPPGAAIVQNIPPDKVKVLAANNVLYTVNASFGNCNTTISSNFTNTITATQNVEITDNTSSTAWCGGTNHTLSVNDFGEGATYAWSYGADFTFVSASPNNQSITLTYNGTATTPQPIGCTVSSYCYQNNTGSLSVDYFGNLLTKQIRTTSTNFITLQTNNTVNDNHAYLRFAQPGLNPNNINYTLTSGFPDVWGSLANDKSQMFVYKRASGGTYTFNAQLVNTTCGTTTNVPFSITLTTGTGFSYEKIFRVVPNPVSSSTIVSINPSAASTTFLNLCINAGAFMRVEVMTTTGFVLQTINGAPFQQTVNVNMSALGTGLYFFRISAIGCPSNGVYQEVQQVQKL